MKTLSVLGIAGLLAIAGACGSNSVVHIAGGDADGGSVEDGGIVSGDGAAGADGPGGNDTGTTGSTTLTTDVKIIIEPNGNDASELVAAINGATKSVHMVMYLFSSTAVEDALAAKQSAGLDVKVMLNQTFVAGQGSNTAIYASLQSKHIPVQWAPIDLTHEKCVIIDGAVAWIMTMNTTESAPTANREFLAIDKDQDDITEAEAIFEADYAHKTPVLVGKLLVAPVNTRERLIALVNGATSTLDIEGEEFSDVQLTDAITARADAGVKVRLVLANVAPSTAQSAAIATLKQHKASVVSVANPYIHAKAMVADGKEMYVGSANFTTGSFNYNRELGIITGAAPEVTAVAGTIAKDFASGSAL